jgi:transcriptional regulator with GAF, ATPase, and Fis domain
VIEYQVDDQNAMDAGDISAPEQALMAAARHLTRRLDVAQTCAATLDAVESVFGATSSWMLLHEPAARQLKVCAFRGLGADCYLHLSIPEDAGIVGRRVFATRRAVFVPDVHAEGGWFDPDRIHRSGLRSMFMAPLVLEGRAVGVIALDSPRFTREHPPQPVDVARLDAIAAQAVIAIDNARLYEATDQAHRRLKEALEQRRELREQVSALQKEARASHKGELLVGSSAVMQDVLRHIETVGRADTTVLLLGETGTGKELVAQAVHRASRRSAGPFIAVNCASLPESLIESELFGHEKGAFTGAISARPGKFELAHRGTLFLDEIGDLPHEAQAKLLRVLQDREVQRIGSTRNVRVDVRVVAATNQDLDRRLADGAFRPDLFYRVSVFPIRLPPLRERPADIALLANYFLSRFSEQLHKRIEGLTPEALDRLSGYSWPGNVRELQNVLERAVILSRGRVVGVDEIGELRAAGAAALQQPENRRDPEPLTGVDSALPTLHEADRRVILRVLEAAGWRISGSGGAAEVLGLKPTTLHAKMKKLGIGRPRPAGVG